MKSSFQFREGCHLSGDAQAVGERFEAIRAKVNALTPEIVLEDARAKRSPLHAFFEWDDGEAAEKYRLAQAGQLIRSVTVAFEDAEPTTERQVSLTGATASAEAQERQVRAFLLVKDDAGERTYVPTREAMGDANLRKQVLASAHRELDSVSRKWRELQELSEVFKALDRIGEILSTERQPA